MPTPMDVRREMRFAVVMYGGVSLATYIHGVTIELMRMVRATAADPEAPDRALLDWDQLAPTERVYRQLGQILNAPGGVRTELPVPQDPVHTRFIVDVLSGTSAGGINAVYLAKALATDRPLTALEKMWLDEGDIQLLLNDRRAGGDRLRRRRRAERASALLDGDRMYQLLLAALDGMDAGPPGSAGANPSTGPSALVDELDLFVTATDILGSTAGLPVTLGHASELRHRTVLHFEYRDDGVRNDLASENNVILGFAARATSSFPFAFEPAQLTDVDRVLARMDGHHPAEGSPNERWARFFPHYPPAGPGSYQSRAFGDGGYLDNKPFSHAIDALALHPTGIPVDRKLIYVEPKPADVGAGSDPSRPPDALENVLAAVSLPRYESVYEDLKRVTDRNRVVRTVDELLSGLERDVWTLRPAGMSSAEWIAKCRWTWRDFVAQDSVEMQRQFGVPYAGYERLEVAVATEDLSASIVRAAGLEADSDQARAMLWLVQAWRDREYPPTPAEADGPTRRHFLHLFNLRYRLRRVTFAIKKNDRLQSSPEYARAMLDLHGAPPLADAADREAFVAELRHIKLGLCRSQVLRAFMKHDLDDPPRDHWLCGPATQLIASCPGWRSLLAVGDESDRRLLAGELLDRDGCSAAFAGVRDVYSANLGARGSEAARLDKEARRATSAAPAAAAAAEIINGFWEMFTYYDVVIFPILHSTGVGELTHGVEVVRISPVDAPTLIDERHDARRKLAGTTLLNFGGFLKRSWRWNDMMWGKLDGVERIVTMCLPSDDRAGIRRALIDGAHAERIAEIVASTTTETSGRQVLAAAADPHDAGSPKVPAGQELVGNRAADEVHDLLRTSYEVDRTPDPVVALQSMGRATQVVGEMLDGLAAEHGAGDTAARWVGRAGRWMWRLVEIAVPQSLPRLVVRHWINVLLFVGVVLGAFGLVFSDDGLLRIGAVLVGGLLALSLAIAVIGDILRGRHRFVRLVALVVVVALVGLAVLGAWHLGDIWDRITSGTDVVGQLSAS